MIVIFFFNNVGAAAPVTVDFVRVDEASETLARAEVSHERLITSGGAD